MEIYRPENEVKVIILYTYCKDYGLHLATVLSTALANSRVHQFMGGDALHSHSLVLGEHPDYHIWDTILGLHGVEIMSRYERQYSHNSTYLAFLMHVYRCYCDIYKSTVTNIDPPSLRHS